MTAPQPDSPVDAPIELWLTHYESIDDAPLLEDYRKLLTDAERERAARFYFEKDRHRFLVTRALVRTVLSRYAEVAPEAWRFDNNEYGRPEASNAAAQAIGLTFNVSHSHGLIVLGVTRHRALGVDTENVLRRAAPVAIADHYFAPSEVAALRALPEARRPARFYEHWTFKESYIKARGMGLALPLDQFAFRFAQDDGVSIEIDARLKDAPSRWQFWQYRPAPAHLVAICAERHAQEALPPPRVRRIVPLMDDTPLELPVTRASAA